jgi:amino acid adenylation domain-containing protein
MAPNPEGSEHRDSTLSQARQALLDLRLRQRRAAEAARNRIVAVPRVGRLPVTEQQRYLWFLHQLAPQVPVYNVPFALRLRGPLDVGALQEALAGLVARHEGLRTRFGSERGVPYQVVAEPAGQPLAGVSDLAGRPAERRWDEAVALAVEQIRQPFDLSTGPLLRCHLARLDPTDHLLTIVIHHIVTDGWSAGILVGDLAELYDAARLHRPAELPELPLAPIDVAVWQQRTLSTEARQRHLDYWRDRLSDVPTLAFPADRLRPAHPTGAGDSVVQDLPGHLIDAARKVAATENVSLLAVFATAMCMVLHRYTGQTDLAFGSVLSGRTRRELEPLVGLFVNPVVLRTSVAGDPTLRELMRRCQETTLDALAHQDVVFGSIVEHLHPERVAGRNPLFQVALSLLPDQIMDDFRFGELSVQNVPLHAGTARFDFSMQVSTRATGDGSVWVEYSTELFERERIERLVVHLCTAVEALGADLDRRVGAVPVLPAEERRRLLAEWNPAPVAFGTERLRLHDLVQAAAAANPDRVAVRFEGRDLSYRDLDARANQLARLLQDEHRVAADTVVGMLLPRGPDVPLVELAAIKAGAVWLPLDPAHPAGRIGFQLQDAAAAVVVTTAALAAALPAGVPRVLLDDPADLARIAAKGSSAPPCPAGPDHGAYLIYTSGSTGTPKGVLVPHRAVVNFVGAANELFHVTPDDRVLQFANPTFDVSVFDVFAALALGAACVAAPVEVLHDPPALAAFMRRERVTLADIAPAVLGLVEDTDLPDLRALFVGIEAFPADLVNRWRTATRAFHNGYGPTEATVACVDYECPAEPLRAAPPIGRAMANMRAFVVDGWGDLAPVGVPGELCVSGPGLARGYVGRPGLTAERFVPCPFDGAGQRMYRTGDVVRWGFDGQLVFLGRIDRQIKLHGLRVELGEIEHTLQGHPELAQVAVVVATGPGGPRLDAYVVHRPGAAPTERALRSWLADRLPAHMVPATFTTLPALPLTGSGKLDRAAMPAPDTAAGRRRAATSTERALAGIWADVLGVPVEGITPDGSFFTLGGSSLHATQMISRVRDALYVDLDPRQLFTHPRLEEMAALVDQALRSDVDEAELAELEAQVAGMSEEELDRLLAEDQ